jgi:ubiquinone/menaquinone biosynthesis C-methylase UbiE
MEDLKRYYDAASKSYDDVFGMLIFRVLDAVTWRFLEPYVPAEPDGMVLDAGGGTGRWATRMAAKGCHVVLMDVSEGMLNVASKRIEKEGLQGRVTIKRGDIADTGLVSETFDLILCEHTLFLLERPDVALTEFKRVLKKGGRLIVSVHNRYVQALCPLETPKTEDMDNALKVLLGQKLGSMMKDGKVSTHTYTPDEFKALLERSGFRVEKIIGKGTTMPIRISKSLFTRKNYSEELFNKILEFEFALCERQDALALAGHLQAVAYKP